MPFNCLTRGKPWQVKRLCKSWKAFWRQRRIGLIWEGGGWDNYSDSLPLMLIVPYSYMVNIAFEL